MLLITVNQLLVQRCEKAITGTPMTTYGLSLSPILNTGLAKKSYSFFHKIKDTFFIFTNNFRDLDIWSIFGYLLCGIMLTVLN